MRDETGDKAGSRISAVLRRLAEGAERDATERARTALAIGRLLDVTGPTPDVLDGVVKVIVGTVPAFDAAGVLSRREEGGWIVQAGFDLHPPSGRLEAAAVAGGVIDDASRSRRIARARPRATGAPWPAGTRATMAIPLVGARGDLLGMAVFGSRSALELGAEDELVARFAAERAAQALERDILDRKIADAEEAARRTAAFRDQILAIVGHDLRNPLGAIVMSTGLLTSRGGLEGWQARTVDRIRSSSARMGRIINDLLSYTRTRLGGGIPLARRPADLGEVIARVVDELGAAHPYATVELERSGDLRGEWDPDRLEQVTSNLVSNAIDHGDEGAPIQVRAWGEGDRVRVQVENRGEMPAAVLEHAFEAFRRGPESTGRKASGLGLGLYIAREIVRCHGGDIAIGSAGGATRTELWLPRRDPNAASRPPPA